eukprot:CAMPEP_0203663750 /NCGR_PEP_ID=MMETSP0090-20130426/1276_1 /ASSEMBLY_ACC=CAM_ASM_001088 /TAXON_ID=426623 /ORGANISM="Chaetoceros affinis, Strain CCMP159" /LENGTH=658 /DNA_ID=CAMNT_0050526755 /DNA_START=149 /DNA_END=2128 /DNA_ORIENTATION=+
MAKKKKKPKKKISPLLSSPSKNDDNPGVEGPSKESSKESSKKKKKKEPKKKKKRRSSVKDNSTTATAVAAATTADIDIDEKGKGSGSGTSPSPPISPSSSSYPKAQSESESESQLQQQVKEEPQPPLPPPPNAIPVPKPIEQQEPHPQQLSNYSSWSEAFQAAASVTPQDLGDDYVDQSFYGGDIGKSEKVPWGSGNVKSVSEIALACIQSNGGIGSGGGSGNDDLHGSSTSIDQNNTKKRSLEDVEGNTDTEHDNKESISPSSSSTPPQPPKKKKKKSKKAKKENKRDAKKLGNDGDVRVNAHVIDNIQDDDDHNHGHDDSERDNEDENDENIHSPPLEGRMINHNNESIMVLLDRKNKIVYSATRRANDNNDDSGNHLVPIGLIDDKDAIRITADIPDDADNDAQSETKGDEHDFPFSVDPDDHCESPLNAYRDIQPILDILTNILGRETKDELSIYDPYYCNGSVVQHLKELGYTNVYNKKEDCYVTWSHTTKETSTQEHQQVYPTYDIFMTNPPYSSDHVEKMIHHLTTDERTKGKPWCLLMPTYVHKKDYYKERVVSKKNSQKGDERKVQPFYLVPKRRYVYLPPPNFREKKLSDVHRKSSPFVSMWFVWGGTKERTELLIKGYKEWEKKNNKCTCDLARGKSALRDLRRKQK